MSDHEVVNQWVDPQKVRTLAEGLLVPVPGTDFTPDESFFGDHFEGFTDQATKISGKKTEVQEEKGATREEPLVVPAMKRDSVKRPPKQDRKIQSDPFRKAKTPAAATGEPPKVADRIKPLPLAQFAPATKKGGSPEKDEVPSPFQAANQQVAPPAAKPSGDKPERQDREPVAVRPYADLKPFINWLKKQNPIHSFFISNQEGKMVFDGLDDEKLTKVGRSLGLAASSPERRGKRDSAKKFTRVRIAEDRFMEILPLDSPSRFLIVGLIVERPLSGPALDIVSRTFHASFSRSSPSGQ